MKIAFLYKNVIFGTKKKQDKVKFQFDGDLFEFWFKKIKISFRIWKNRIFFLKSMKKQYSTYTVLCAEKKNLFKKNFKFSMVKNSNNEKKSSILCLWVTQNIRLSSMQSLKFPSTKSFWNFIRAKNCSLKNP